MENQTPYGNPSKKPYPIFDDMVITFPLWKERIKTILRKYGFSVPLKSEIGLEIEMRESLNMLQPIRYKVYYYEREDFTLDSIRVYGSGDTVEAALTRFEGYAIQVKAELEKLTQEGGNNE